MLQLTFSQYLLAAMTLDTQTQRQQSLRSYYTLDDKYPRCNSEYTYKTDNELVQCARYASMLLGDGCIFVYSRS